MRPIRPEDAGLERQFFDALSERSRYQRYMLGLAERLGFMQSGRDGDLVTVARALQ